MKVLVVMHDFRAGGAEKVSVCLANKLSENHNVSVVYINEFGPFKEQLNDAVNQINLNKTRLLNSLPALVRVISKGNFDIVISHLTHINVASILSCLMTGNLKKLVVVEHSQMDLNYDKLKSKFMQGVYLSTKILYNYPRKVVGVSDGVCEGIKKFTGLKSNLLKTIYNPVLDSNLVLSKTQPNSRTLPCSNTPVFVYVGRLISSKRVDVLLKAFSLVLESLDSRLIIVGDGEEKERLISYSLDLNLGKKVDFLGFVSNPIEIMSNSNCLVLTSEWEGLPTVLIEALSVGIQCVSTNCPSGPSEILNHGEFGFLCNVNDPVDISKKMILSINEPKINIDLNLGRFEKKLVSQEYLGCVL